MRTILRHFIYLKIDNQKLMATQKIEHYHICICISRSEVLNTKTFSCREQFKISNNLQEEHHKLCLTKKVSSIDTHLFTSGRDHFMLFIIPLMHNLKFQTLRFAVYSLTRLISFSSHQPLIQHVNHINDSSLQLLTFIYSIQHIFFLTPQEYFHQFHGALHSF